MSDSISAGKVSMKVEGDAKGFGSSVAHDIEAEEGFFSHIGHKLGETVVAGFAAIGLGTGIVETIKTGFEAYSNWEAMNAQFAAGIKSTGNAAGLSVEEMDKLAESVSNYSGQTVNSIGKTEQVLQTFEGIKNVGPHKIFDQATVAAANMAAKLGGDASGSAIQLGKALQDPVKGMTALRRVGVSFTDSQQAAIKADVKRGDTLAAQSLILKELGVEFGGAAKAAGQTFPGEVNRAKNSLEELARAAVTAIGPILTPILGSFADKVGEIQKKVEEAAGSIQTTLVPKIANIKVVIGEVFQLLAGNDSIKFKPIDLGPWTKPLLLLGSIVRQIGGAFGEFFRSIGDTMKSSGGTTNSALAGLVLNFLKLVQSLSPLSILLKAVGPQLPSLVTSLAQMLQSVTPLATGMASFAAQVVAWLVPILKSPPVIKAIVAGLILWKAAMVGAGVAKHAKEVSDLVKTYGGYAKTAAGAVKVVATQVVGIAKDFGQTIAIQAMYAKDAVVKGAQAAAAWVSSAAKSTAGWVAAKAKIIAAWVAQAAASTVNAAKAAAVWVVQAAKATAAWVASKAVIIAGFVATAAAAVANGAKMAAVWLAQKAGVIAYIAVQGLLKAAQVAATVAQWAFNAAMDANPIGIIIVAIAALVAGLIWFFTQTTLGKAIWQDIVNFLVAAWQVLVAAAKVAWDFIVNAVVTAINVVKQIINTVVSWISAYWSLEVRAWQLVITTVFDAIRTVVTTVINVVKGIINTVVSWISAFWNAEVTGWRTIITTVFNAISSVVSGVINTVRSIISGAINFVTGVWRSGWNLILSTAKSILDNVISAVSGAIKNVISFFSSLGSKIIGAIGNAGSMLVTVGQQIIQGLINGVTGMVGNVTSAIGNLVGGAISTAKNALGIKSPSRVFAAIGQYVGQGFEKGITGSASSVQSAMQTLTNKVVSTFDSLVKQRTTAQAKLKKLDQEYANVSGITAAAKKRRALLESEIADQKSAVAVLTKEASAKTESTLLSLIKRENVTLTAEAKRRDALTASITNAQQAATQALNDKSNYATGIKDAVIGDGNVVDSNSTSSSDIIAKLQKAVADTQTLSADIGKLQGMGLDATTLKQIADAGVSNGGLAAAEQLLAGGKSAVTQVASLQSQLTQAGTRLGSTTSSDLYNTGVQAAQGLVSGLQSQEKAINDQMSKIASSMVSTIKKDLNIKSPSRVMAALGGFTGQGFAQGISDSIPVVTKATVAMAAIPTTASSKFNLNGLRSTGVGAGDGTTIVNQFNGQMGYSKDEVVDSIVTRQRRAQSRIRVPRVAP